MTDLPPARIKLTADRPFATPEAAARKLVEIVLSNKIDVGQHTYTGVTNITFTRAGGTVAEHAAGRDYAIAHGGFDIDSSGTRIMLKQVGAEIGRSRM
jgi:hypothetical protein